MTLHFAIRRAAAGIASAPRVFPDRVPGCYITNHGIAGDGGQCRETPRARPLRPAAVP